MDTFQAVIDLWPSLSAFAEDIDVIYVTAQAMYRRDSIDAAYWSDVVEGARKRKIEGVTLERLAALAAARRSSQRTSVAA